MKGLLPLLLPLPLLATIPRLEPEVVKASIPVVDLRVGLSRSLMRDGSLAKGVGQAGYVELARGGVAGVIVPFPSREGVARAQTPVSAFFALRRALAASQRFKRDGCNGHSAGIGAWLSLEDPNELARAPAQVGLWTTRGVRLFSIADRRDNDLATSASPIGPGAITGLTTAGRDVVQRILAAGALVDVSSASELTIDEIIGLAQVSHSPVIASHANARALADSPWNLRDTQIRGIAKTGGVVGVTARRGLLAPGRRAALRHLVEQIRHMIRVVGPDYVALGSSFEDDVSSPLGFRSAAHFPRLARALQDAGLSRAVIEQVFYKNAWRVLCPRASSSPVVMASPSSVLVSSAVAE